MGAHRAAAGPVPGPGESLTGRPTSEPPHSPPWRIAGGVLSGAFGGLVGNQGGIRAAALLGCALAPRALVATATATAMLVDCARFPVYLFSAGDVIGAAVPVWGAGIAGVTIGTYVGVRR